MEIEKITGEGGKKLKEDLREDGEKKRSEEVQFARNFLKFQSLWQFQWHTLLMV